jgi:hypothetical protein
MAHAAPYAMSKHANAAFPVSRPMRTVMVWALLRSATSDTGNMAPKDCKENTEGVSGYPPEVSSAVKTGADLRVVHVPS